MTFLARANLTAQAIVLEHRANPGVYAPGGRSGCRESEEGRRQHATEALRIDRVQNVRRSYEDLQARRVDAAAATALPLALTLIPATTSAPLATLGQRRR